MAVTSCIIIVMATLAVFAGAQSYCNMKSCGSRNHTRCSYPTLQPAARCGKVQSSRLTQRDIDVILKKHNEYRARAASGQEQRGNPGPQPAATDIGNLQWDQELADIAQTWADQCNFGHDKCRDSARFTVGQNIARGTFEGSTDETYGKLVDLWYDEVKIFNRNGVKSYSFDPNTGHYTQLVWAKSKYLGCGGIRYSTGGGRDDVYIVCNYGPHGNVLGQPIYNTR